MGQNLSLDERWRDAVEGRAEREISDAQPVFGGVYRGSDCSDPRASWRAAMKFDCEFVTDTNGVCLTLPASPSSSRSKEHSAAMMFA